MLLYNSQLSGNCYKVRLLLARRGIDYEKVELSVTDRTNRQEVLGDVNPALRVPVLRLDDGRHLAESNAIIWYLAEGTDLVPEEPFRRAKVLQWMFFEQYDHEPNLAVARFIKSILGSPPELATKLAERQDGSRKVLHAMEQHLSDRTFLVGERYTLADVALYAYTHIADEAGITLSKYPAVQAWLEAVAAVPGHISMTDGGDS